MSKKQMIRRRGLCGLLALTICIGVMPPTAGAAVTTENDWEIFDASDTYNLPGTQEQILQENSQIQIVLCFISWQMPLQMYSRVHTLS